MRTHTHIKSTPTHSVRPQIHTHTRTHKAFTNSSPTHPARNHTHTHTYIHSRMHACIHTKSSERPSHHPPPLFIRPSSLWRLTLSSPSLSISPRFFLIPSFKTVLLHKTLRMSQRTEKESKTKKVQTVHPPPPPSPSYIFLFFFPCSCLTLVLSPGIELGRVSVDRTMWSITEGGARRLPTSSSWPLGACLKTKGSLTNSI